MGQSDAYAEQQEAAQRAASAPRPITTQDLDIRFASHSVSPAEQDQIDRVRWEFRRLAGIVVAAVPAGRDASSAVTHLEQSMFIAIAGIARS